MSLPKTVPQQEGVREEEQKGEGTQGKEKKNEI